MPKKRCSKFSWSRKRRRSPLLKMLRKALVLVLLAYMQIPRFSVVSADAGRCPSIGEEMAVQNDGKTQVREIKMGQRVQREMAGGDSHSYVLNLTRGQF